MCVLPDPEDEGRSLLASAGNDGDVHIWDPATGEEAGEPITGYPDSLLTVCAVPGQGNDGRILLATTGYDGTIVVWDPATREPAGYPLAGDAGPAWGICVLPAKSLTAPNLPCCQRPRSSPASVWNATRVPTGSARTGS